MFRCLFTLHTLSLCAHPFQNPGSLSHSECSSPSLITPPQSPLNLETSSFASTQSQSSVSTLPRISVSPVPMGERRKDRYNMLTPLGCSPVLHTAFTWYSKMFFNIWRNLLDDLLVLKCSSSVCPLTYYYTCWCSTVIGFIWNLAF